MQKICLWTELWCNSDVRESVRLSQSIKGVTVDSNGECEETVSSVRSRVRVMCSIRVSGKLELQLEFASASDVRVRARISLRFKVK